MAYRSHLTHWLGWIRYGHVPQPYYSEQCPTPRCSAHDRAETSPSKSGTWLPMNAIVPGTRARARKAVRAGRARNTGRPIHRAVSVGRGEDPAGVKVDGGASVKSFISFKINLGS